MEQKILSKTSTFLILLAIFLFLYLNFDKKEFKNTNSGKEIYKTVCGEYEKGEVKISEVLLSVNIADSNCKRTLGLSGKPSLNEEGMMFVFEKMGNYTFWMKNMLFPIDIIWIDDNFNIVGIEKNLSPDSYPKSFGEKYQALYVLEVPTSYSEKNNIKVGDKIVFTKK